MLRRARKGQHFFMLTVFVWNVVLNVFASSFIYIYCWERQRDWCGNCRDVSSKFRPGGVFTRPIICKHECRVSQPATKDVTNDRISAKVFV